MASSLALYYRFNMSAGATSVPDLSGNGLTGLLPNGGTFNNDFLYLNSANNQWVNISSGIKPYLNTQDYSIMGCVVSKNPAAWARFFDFNTKYQTGISASDVYWEGTFNYQGANKIGYEIRNTNLYYSSGGSTATITGGKWQHVAWVGNASHVNIYLNGNSVFVNSLGATPSNFYPSSFYTSLMNFGIGKSWDNTNQYCNMDIYNFKVYTAALTPADLKAEGEACLSQNPTTSPTTSPTGLSTQSPTTFPTFSPPPPSVPVEPLGQGVVCGPEISIVRRHLSSADHDADHGDRALLQGYTPQTCYEACVARIGPTPGGFVINLYYNENGEQVCTCCRECEGVRYVPSAQLYAVCSAATSGGLTLATATSPRRVVRPGRTVRYKVSLRPATKQPKAKATSQAAGGPTLNLRVALPAGVRYMQSTTSPPLLAYSAGGRKAKRQPVLANDSAVLTWEDIGVTRKGRDFVVKVRVDSAIASGTPLTFSAQLFESVQVGAGTSAVPACPRSAPNATVTVV